MVKCGKVINACGEFAEVLFARSSACGESCTGCGACSKRHHTAKVKNSLNAKPGDSVIVTLSDKGANSALFLIFILPVIIFVCGYSLVFALLKNHALSAVISAAVLAVYLFLLKKHEKLLAPIPEITEILPFGKDETNGA